MVKSLLKYFVGLLLLLMGQAGLAQGHLFSRVELNKNSVFVGEPVEVQVSVYTSTWFTKGVNPGNIKVNGAFTVYFRSISNSQQIKGKTYAGVTLIFNVFPYKDEDLEFPSLNIQVETPDEGGYKGEQHTVKTAVQIIKVKQLPPGFDKDAWMVANRVSISEEWTGNTTTVKVGDVVQRRITRSLVGSVAELIPPIVWDTLPDVSIYAMQGNINNKNTRTEVQATRSEGVQYLFEKEGFVVIPDLVFTWWNPILNRLQNRTLKGRTLNVLANPNLGMLTSVRDSLVALVPANEVAKDTDKGIWGLSITQLLLLLGSGIILFFIVFMLLPKLFTALKASKARYSISEPYYFKEFKKALLGQDIKVIAQHAYIWIDALKLKESTLFYFAKNYGSIELLADIDRFHSEVNLNTNEPISMNIKPWLDARKNYFKEKRAHASGTLLWVNP